ncbi:unnamed protein product [Schistosoma intercalatum]|nr:unnamed protein product [Schistosoma intercalatum]
MKQRIYDGPGNCEPQLPNSDLYYGIGLLSPTSDKGYIMCKRSVSYTGSVNISFIVDAPYGRSKTLESVYRVDRNEQTFMHQSYSVISNVTSIQTSSFGGGSIEITGEYLNSQNDIEISVGYTKCSPTLVNSTYINCILDQIEQTPKPKFYPGNRGLTVQFWSDLKASSVSDLLIINFDQMTNTTLQETYLYEPEFIPKDLFNGTGIIRLSMIFVPPKNSYYQFLITSANTYALLGGGINETLTQMAITNSRTNSIYLNRNEHFLLELRSIISQPTAVVRLCASLSNTSLNYQQLKISKPTSYLISINSNANSEKQVIDHSALVNSSIIPIAEIQTISIPTAATQYKLCLFYSCTSPFPVQNPNVDLISQEISEKLNGSSVKTKVVQITNDYLVLQITFPEEFGDMPLLDVQSFPQTINKSQVNETVQGMTGFSKTIRPSYGGMYSYMTYTLDSTENEIRLAYLNLGSSWCPSKLINPTFKYAVLDDFETSTLSTVTTETVAFCGRQSALNLFTYQFAQLISVNTNPYLCFAIKGKTRNSINFLYNAIGVTSRLLKQTLTYSIDLTQQDENSWKFKCINVLQLLRTDPRNINATIFQLESFSIPPRKKFYELEYTLFLDTVYMGTKPISDNPDDVVTWPRFPKDIFSDIKITKNLSTFGVFTIEIITKSCRTNFELFGLTGVNMPNDNKTIDRTVILRDERWPVNIQSSITLIQSASPPIDGNFILSFKGVPTSRIPAKYMEPSVIERLLNLHPLMGTVRVSRYGWCRSFQYNFWLESLPGDQPEISVMNETTLIGDSPQITIRKSAIGELVMCPISGDMVATKHSVPQVRLYIDNFPAYCKSSCDHQFVDLSSPVVTNSIVQITNNNLTLILNGTDFIANSPNSYELFLMFNEELVLKQQPFLTTTTNLYFFNQDFNVIPSGLLTGRLRLTDKGFINGPINIGLGTEGSEIKDIVQTGIFDDGKEYLKITGSRFLPNHSSAYFDDIPCKIINMTTTEINCLLPISELSGQKLVKIQQHSSTISKTEDFTAIQANGPVITSVEQTQIASVSGTTQIIINGLRFTPTMLIFVGGVKVENFTFVNETQIIILAPAQKINGEKTISLYGSSNVLIKSDFSVTYKFEIADIRPQIGSFVGGQIVNIVGEGFDDDVKVFMKPITVENQLCNDRPRAECGILSKSSTTIQCKTTSMVKTHYILDNGIDSVRGLGYEWQPKALTIIQGDSVVWIWNTSTRVNPLMIAEISGLEDLTPSGSGFHSGEPTQNGVYRFNFTQPGTYYYTSSDEFLMTGIIEVKAFDDCMTEVIVETNYSTAIHTNIPDTLYWDSLTTCEGGFTCQILTKPSELLTKHGFVYRGCATPIVSSFSPFNIYAGSKITVSSPVLANCVDQLMINVGGADCTQPVQDINDSESIECDLSEEQVISAGLLTGQPLKPCISHNHLGFALLHVSTNEFEQYAFFWPGINCDKTYGKGSIYGGGQLIVYGSGFDPIYKDFNKITFNNEKECSIIEVTSGYIKCLVPIPDNTTIESNLNVTIQVQIKSRNQNDWIDTQHTTHSDCLYSYDITATPIIKNIEPREIININQTLIIYGSNLLLSNENYTNLQITLDNTPCIIDTESISINKLSCQLMNSLSSGYVTLKLFHEIRGYSKYETNLTIKSQITFYTIYPLEGSFAGGTIIKLNGNGLNDPTIKILFNLKECQIINEKNRTVNEIYCRTPEQLNYIQLNNYKVSINLSNGLFITNEYTYVNMKTPKVINITMNSINNNNGTLITQLNINGSMLNGDNNTQMKMTEVKLNQTLCTIVTIQNDYIQCYIVNLPSGIYQLIVDTPVYGYALSENNININFSLNSISPNSGGTEGGQLVEIQGIGMDVERSTVTICDQDCPIVGGSSLALKCITPKLSTLNIKMCDVTVTVPTIDNVLQKKLIGAFKYDVDLSPRIISVDPLIGGTGGGTILTIIGTLFDESTTVNVGGIDCQLISLNNTVIVCQTGEHNGSAKVPVEVTVENNGKASGDFTFYYVDRWSSQFTWNNQPIPVENDFVVINANQNIMLDVDTPVLSMLLINGGTLFFDPTKNIQLNSKYILILNNGKFLIGSPEEPYTKQATITLHGHVREKELPLYGAKVLALRNGTISIHGKPRIITWTRLAKTAEPGTNTLILEHPVDWQPGEHIIITSTGGKSSHNESEEHIIQEMSADNLTITLVSPLAYKKLSVKKIYSNGVIGNFAAEVGLLSRNILIRGTEEPVVSSSVPKCPSDFSTDQFATHTCIIGSPDEQLGANEYGGHVHIGGPFVDSGAVKVYISHTEFYFMGQAYRLGRYPIHFHLNGLMNGSYVRGCSIHKTFNRAINIHNTHEVLIENNVVYDVMGGAFFLEDGIEHGNLIQYNLFVHVKRTSSLLNDDVVPAAFWITQPNNTVQHNVAASGTHFGFWYRMLENPSGPSTTTSICTRKIPLGIFENNTAHSNGWFALWIYESFFLTKTGTCGTTKWDKAVFRKLTAWNNNKGPECVNCGGVQFEDMLLVNNDETAIEGKRLMNGNLYDPTTDPLYRNSTIVGYEPDLNNGTSDCHTRAVILPWAPGLSIENMVMKNFNSRNCTAIHGTVITCQCRKFCGGYEYLFKDIKWEDTNGSLTDGIPNVPKLPGSLVVGKANHLPTDKCGPSAPGAGDLGSAFGQGAVPGVRCLPDVTALRYAVDQTNPPVLMGSNMTVTLLDGGTEEVPFKSEALTDKQGWMTTLVNNRTYIVNWDARSSFTNLSYIGYLENFRQSDHVIIRHMGMDIKPDRVQVLSGQTPKQPIAEPLDPSVHDNGEVFYNETGKYIEYLVKAPVNPSLFNSYRLWVSFYKCFFTDCIVPSSSSVSVLDTSRPVDALYWSKNNTWGDVLGPQPVNGSSRNMNGIIRDNSCIYMPKMQAYKCSKALDHKVLLIESMDPDALERRLSPIAFATDGLSANYIDLINGPSDHGVCSSYACLKRMSTFMSIVARQKNFVMYMTSTPPQELRLRLPQADPDYAVRLGIDYFTAGRLDVYVNGVYMKAKNAITNNLGQTVLQAPKTLNEFMPNVITDPAGTNYFDDSAQMLYVIIKGEDIITIKLSQLIKVAFGLPAMTIDQFYGSEVVNNLANYLGIPAKNIRIVKVVSESSTNSGRRRRRSASGVFVELEISTPPSQNLSTGVTPNVTSGLTKVEEISSNVVTLIQTGLLESVINTTVVSVTIQKPTPLSGSALWAAQVSDSTTSQQIPETIQIPVKSQVKVVVPTGYTSVVEGVPFTIEISTLDSSGNIVKPLGSNSSIWAYEILQPNATVSPVKVSKTNFPDPTTGTALISNLIFSESGQADLFVSVISPNDSTRLNTSVTFPVTQKQLSLLICPIPSNSDNSIIKLSVNQSFTIQMIIIDKQTGAPVEMINWRNLIWKFTGDICPNSRKPKNIPINSSSSSLLYDSSKTNNNFTWTINGFQLSWVYTYCISANAYLNDNITRQLQYDLPITKLRIYVNPENYTEPTKKVIKPFRFKVNGNYENMLLYVDEFKAAIQSELLMRYPNILFENITLSKGSITVDLIAASDTTNVIQNALTSFTSSLNDGSVTFSVGGVDYTATNDKTNAGCRSAGFPTSLITILFNLLIYKLLPRIYLF